MNSRYALALFLGMTCSLLVLYYASFPPVSYSAPVPRNYGYSTDGVAPLEIINPYYKPATNSTPPETEDKITQVDITRSDIAQPLLVMNPYVSARLTEASVTSTPLGR